MNTRQNNKGFSLVELIVVIAIMGILAVTLAPRLSQYIEKARVASDQEAVSAIFTAAKLAAAEYPVGDNLVAVDLGGTPATVELMYVTTDAGTTWTPNTTYAPTATNADFLNQMADNLGAFVLKASAAKETGAAPMITISSDADSKITVELDYNGTDTIEVSE